MGINSLIAVAVGGFRGWLGAMPRDIGWQWDIAVAFQPKEQLVSADVELDIKWLGAFAAAEMGEGRGICGDGLRAVEGILTTSVVDRDLSALTGAGVG